MELPLLTAAEVARAPSCSAFLVPCPTGSEETIGASMAETARHIATESSRRQRRIVPSPFDPVMQSLAGIIGESAGLVGHLAALGIALAFDTDTTATKHRPTATPRPTPDAANIIRFPARQNTKPRN
ncbi:hypothetical protein [Bradyrhizobium viridifuturi]|uniref:hypothetical protein n=1 Tax=Bradyrhizobium viridifuturi TaxID=1654716 RepID=UPI00067EEB87|nr:hypothetical protein [Bradyrhizobium viridifuturi]